MKNLSKLSFAELAARECEDLQNELNGDPGQVVFNSGLRLSGIYPIQLCAGDYESISDPLKDMMDNGDLDELFGREVDAEFLSEQHGYIVIMEFSNRDYSSTTFDETGRFDHVRCCGWGVYQRRYVLLNELSDLHGVIAREYENYILRQIERGSQGKS
jgi:hypothetical protein